MRHALSLALAIALPFSASAELLQQEPKPGTLPEGTRAYVDDGTCPSGQVKQLTGGTSTIKRQRRCVPLDTMRAEEAAAAAPARWTAVLALESGPPGYCGLAGESVRQTIAVRDGVFTATNDRGATWTLKNFSKRLRADGSGRYISTMENTSQEVVFTIEPGQGPRKIRMHTGGCVFLSTPS